MFPGNLDDGHTLAKALTALDRRHPETRFTLVADADMLSRANRQALQERETPYILGARLKASPQAFKAQILDVAALRNLSLNAGSRLVVTHSPCRACKHAHDRTCHIKKLEKGATPAAFSPSGAVRFLDFPDGRVILNEDKITQVAA